VLLSAMREEIRSLNQSLVRPSYKEYVRRRVTPRADLISVIPGRHKHETQMMRWPWHALSGRRNQ
jgi:hypothetical protein